MEDTYLSANDIIKWINDWSSKHPTPTGSDRIDFAKELNNNIGKMDFHAYNGGQAVGYAGTIGDSTGIFKTVEQVTEAGRGQYSFINMCVENIQNNKDFLKALKKAVGKEDAKTILSGTWTGDVRLKTSFGDVLSINDFVSDNYVLNNARGDVQLIITDRARFDSVLNVTELERLLVMDKVTHINGIPKTQLQNMDSLTRFNLLKEQSVLGLSNARIYVDASGETEILSLKGTKFDSLYPGVIPDGYTESRTYLPDSSFLYYDKDGVMLGALSASKVPVDYAFSATIGEIKNFPSDADERIQFGSSYDNFSAVEKMQAKHVDYYVHEITNLHGASIADDVLARYLIASGKTLDTLNDTDKALLAVAQKIGSNSDDIASLLSKVSKYDVLKVASEVGGIVDVVATTATIGTAIGHAVEAYNSGDPNKAAAIIVAATSEFTVGLAGGWALTSAIAPYLTGFGAAVGGPIGAGIGGIIAGLIGYEVAGFAGSTIYDTIMDWFEESEKTVLYTDPLVLDLAGNGFNPTGVKDGAYFDLDQNGFAEKMGWVQGDDALLAIDKNQDGFMNNGSELFGDQTRLKTGQLAKNGFEALKEYDTNHDGIIDQNDTDFTKILVWKDINGNGVSETGELITLEDAGIGSIYLSYQGFGETTSSGTVIGNVATFKKVDGTEYRIGEYWVQNETYNTKDLNTITIPNDIMQLPNIKEIGLLPSLRKAMALDQTGRLKALVTEFMNSKNADERYAIIENILLIATGAEKFAANSRGDSIDAQKLVIVESMLGRAFQGIGGANPNATAAVRLKDVYQDLVGTYYCELAAQTNLKAVIPYIRIAETEQGKSVDLFYLKDCLPLLIKGNEAAQLGDLAKYMKYLEKSGIEGFNDFINYFGAKSEDALKSIATGVGISIIGTDLGETLISSSDKNYVFGDGGDDIIKGIKGNDFLLGGSGNDKLYGEAGTDVLEGGAGDDYLEGKNGNDTYLFGRGDGIDIIYDNEGYEAKHGLDTLQLKEGITESDIELVRTGADWVEVRIKGTQDKVTLKGMFNAYNGVDQIRFADGTIISSEEIRERVNQMRGTEGNDILRGFNAENYSLYGYEGDDQLYGAGGNDVLEGESGNDYLEGGRGNDTYLFNDAFGNDTVYNNTSASGDYDKALFGYDSSKLVLGKESNDLSIKVAGQADSVLLKNWNWGGSDLVDEIGTLNGEKLFSNQVAQLIQAMATFTNKTGFTWEQAAVQQNQQYLEIISSYYNQQQIV